MYLTQDEKLSPEKPSYHKSSTYNANEIKGSNDLGTNKKKIVT